MIVDAAFAPARATPPRPLGWEIALFAVALAVSGLVVLTIMFSGPSTYAEIARASGRETATFRTHPPPPSRAVQLDLQALLGYHVMWVDYVTGRTAGIFRISNEIFTDAEHSHMADVRQVFISAQVAAWVAALALAWLALRAWRRRTLARLFRAAALLVLVVVAAIGALAALAFDAAFLLFHQIFFPQGNFLFEPGSNLLALYPQEYFYGVTLRIGGTFVLAALVLAAVAHLSFALRSRVPVDSRA